MSPEGAAKLSEMLPGVADGLSEALDEFAGEHVLFALFIFGDGEKGARGHFVSNAEREGIARELRKLLDRWEQTGGDDGPYHIFHKAH